MNPASLRESVGSRIQALERRGSRVSRLSVLVLLGLTEAGLIILLARVAWPGSGPAETQAGESARYLALAAVVLAFGLALISLWKLESWRSTRERLVGELVRRDAMDNLLLLDPVTGVFNRRYLDEVLQREVSRVERRDASLSFLKVRIEDFEGFESHAGGEVGEMILKDVAQVLYRNLRPTDVVVRYERNEFLVIMSETSKHGALSAVRRLLERVEEINQANQGILGYPIELSYGLAGHLKGQDVRDVIAAADHSITLYRERAS